MPRKTRVGRRPRLHPFSAEFHALKSGPDFGVFSGLEIDCDIEQLWRAERERLDDEREFGAFWFFEFGIDWPEAAAAGHVHLIAQRKGLDLSDEAIIARAREYVADDPRLS
ncbi:MAG: hypothetical protein ACRD3V_11890 [Vicinamibacteria bacterium]